MVEPVTTSGALVAAAAAALPPAIIRTLENLGARLAAPVANFAKSTRDRAFANLKVGFQDPLNISYERCRFFKTILNPGVPVELKTHYVHVTLSYGKRVVTDDSVIAGLEKDRRVVITGLAGSGKSMFMKYLTIQKFEEKENRVPLFVELRRMNGLTELNLLTFIRLHCTSKHSKVTQEQFELSLRSGGIMLILDGFDELHHEHRDAIQKQILELTKDFPDAKLIISSRPDDRFGGWSSFHVYKVDRLTKEQCLALIGTLQYDTGVRHRFLIVVKDKLYDSHQSFLSSPLLTTIMLLTYEEFAEIPDKMHAFYSQAFDTLFQKHDAQKEQFNRRTYTGLTREDFKSCLAAFSAMSYLQGTHSFSYSLLVTTAQAAVNYLRGADRQSFPNLTAEQFINDLRESVCLLQQDGLDFTFVHRSFQEYFAAVFAITMHSSKIKAMFDQFSLRFTDSVISMARDMNSDVVEREWVIPTMEKIGELLELANKGRNLGTVYGKFMPDIHFGWLGDEKGWIAPYPHVKSDTMGALESLTRLYPRALMSTSPFDVLVPLSPEEFRSKFLKPEHKEKHNYSKFDRFASDMQAFNQQPMARRQTERDPDLHVKISHLDDWWLRETDFASRIDRMKAEFR